MEETLLLIGVGCVIAAIVGGSLKILHVELPAVASVHRQILLSLAGSALIIASFALADRNEWPTTIPAPAQPAAAATFPSSKVEEDLPLGGSDEPAPPGLFEPAEVTLSGSSGPAGSAVTVSGTGFAPSEEVVIRFHTRELSRVQTDAQGAFSGISVRVPPDWRFSGQFDFVATGRSSLRSARGPFHVT